MVAAAKKFIKRHKKYIPVIFFVGGFIWDSLTLGRIDGWYSNTVLLFYLTCLTLCLYIYNLADDNLWDGTYLDPYYEYAPLAIQFFLGGLCSAYVIFFFQSVSLTKAMVFFLILVVLLFSNELLKHRISNKYLQFGAYFFVNFTFFTFFTPVIFGVMSTFLFVVSGLISLAWTIFFIFYIYRESPSTRREITGWKIAVLIFAIYGSINVFYYYNMIPPVPLSLETGIIAHNVEKKDNTFRVSYEQTAFYDIWETYDRSFNYAEGDTVFAFTSIFAPTDLKKSVKHRWEYYNPDSEAWSTTDTIAYQVIGGRRGGFRGYTFKRNIWPGRWRVSVTTGEGMVLGELNFSVVSDSASRKGQLTERLFK